MKNLDENTFKSTYIATFMASYMASRYERDCADGHQGKSYENQPLEDAVFLAECAWNQIQNEKRQKLF